MRGEVGPGPNRKTLSVLYSECERCTAPVRRDEYRDQDIWEYVAGANGVDNDADEAILLILATL